MRARDIVNNIRDRLNNDRDIEPGVNVEEHVNGPEAIPEPIHYFQWYEEDPERLRLEQEKMESEFSGFKCYILNDARVCFAEEISNHEVAIVCPHGFPIEVPESLIISGDALSSKLVSPDGLIDIFGSGDVVWDANSTFVVDIARKVRSMLEMFVKLQDGGSEETTEAAKNEESVVKIREAGPIRGNEEEAEDRGQGAEQAQVQAEEGETPSFRRNDTVESGR